MTMNPYRPMARFREELRHFLRRTATVSELVQKLALTQSAVTELVQRAEQAGLVARTPSTEDGRVVNLSMTERGAAKLDAVSDALEAERAHLREIVDKL